MRLAAALIMLGAVSALAGCATSDRDQVRSKVDQLAGAVAGHDYKALCDQVLAPSLVERLLSAGVSCEQAMRVAFGRVQEPTLSIGRIVVSGHTAQAIALTTAKGQQASIDAIDLIKTSKGWRISSLGTPSSTFGAK